MDGQYLDVYPPVKDDNEKLSSIIFIDDEEAILASLRSLLRRENYNQHYFVSPKAALEFLRENRVDLIITDLRMSEMSGEQFLKEANKIDKKAIKIILSAYEDKMVVLESLAKGHAHFYLLKPWDDEELKKLLRKFADLHNDLEQKHLIEYLNSFSDLPSPSSLNKEVLEFFSKEVTIHELVEFLEHYPYVVTKLIQIANSVYYGSRREITTIKDAVMLMGIEPLRELLLSLGIFDKFRKSIPKEYYPLMNDIWNRSLRRGIISKKISSVWDKPFDKVVVFISSLVCDVGFFVWLYSEPEKYKEFIGKLTTEEKSLQEMELEYFQYTHTKLGAMLLELWNFPLAVINIVRNHHEVNLGNEVIKIIQLSEILEGSFPNIQHNKSIDYLIPYYKEKFEL